MVRQVGAEDREGELMDKSKPSALDDVRNALNNARNPSTEQSGGDGVALTSCGGPHFAPQHPPVGTVFHCAITECAWVYVKDKGQEGWEPVAGEGVN